MPELFCRALLVVIVAQVPRVVVFIATAMLKRDNVIDYISSLGSAFGFAVLA
jgi:hypothetical protein